eukprot:gene2262-biopygen2015
MNVYEVEISIDEEKVSMKSVVNGVKRKVLLNLLNPKHHEVIETNSHLKGVKMDHVDKKEILPVQVLLGASSYPVIKTSTQIRVGKAGERIAEKTGLGWVIMSQGREGACSALMFTRTPHDDYMQVCSLDVLGVEDRPEGDQQSVYEELKEQLVQRDDGRTVAKPDLQGISVKFPTIHCIKKKDTKDDIRYQKVMRSERVQKYLAQQGKMWQFYLNRASWWGGMFERMVSMVKVAMYKVIGGSKLPFKELQEAILNIQIVLNNRPLTYCKDNVEMPVLTPHLIVFGRANYLPVEEQSAIQDRDLRKKARYLKKLMGARD